MFRPFVLRLSAVLVLALAAACGSKPVSSPPEAVDAGDGLTACSSDSDCTAEQRCYNGHCFPKDLIPDNTVPDRVAPKFAGAGSAEAVDQVSVKVSWTAATDDVTAPGALTYKVWAAETSGGEAFDAEPAATANGETSVVVKGLKPFTRYYFVVRAFDEAKNFDINTVEVVATTLPQGVTGQLLGSITLAADARHAVRDGDTLFVALGTDGIAGFNLADPAKPVQIGALALAGDVQHLVKSGDLLYAALGAGGLAIIDVKDAAKPKVVSTFAPTGAVISQLVLLDGVLYAAAGSVIYSVDVRAPWRPEQIGPVFSFGAAISRLTGEGTRLFAASADGKLSALSVQLSGAVGTVGASTGFRGEAVGLAVKDGILYLAAKGGGFAVYDARDAAKITRGFALESPSDLDASGLDVRDGMLTVSQLGGVVRVFSLLSPLVPAPVSNAASKSPVPWTLCGDGMVLFGVPRGVQLVDVPPFVTAFTPVTGATGVSPVAPLKATFSEKVTTTSITTNTLTVMGASAVAGKVALDAKSHRTATFTPNAAMPSGATTFTVTNGIISEGPNPLTGVADWKTAFTVGNDAKAPTFAGVTEAFPQGSTKIGLKWAAATDDSTQASGIRYAVYMGTAAGAENFATPVLVTAPGATTAVVYGLVPQTRYAFVVRAIDAAGNEETNTVEKSATTFPGDFSAPQTGSFTPAQAVTGATGQGHYAYLCAGTAGVLVTDVSSGPTPKLVGTLALGGESCSDVSVAGGLAVVGTGNGEVRLFDVRTPSAPVALGRVTVKAGQAVAKVASFGTFVYAAVGAQIFVVDASDALAPTVGTTPLTSSGPVVDLAVSGARLYSATENGVAVYGLGGTSAGGSPSSLGTIDALKLQAMRVTGNLVVLQLDGAGLVGIDATTVTRNPTPAFTLAAPGKVVAFGLGSGMLSVSYDDGNLITYALTELTSPQLLSSNYSATPATWLVPTAGVVAYGYGTAAFILDMPPVVVFAAPGKGETGVSPRARPVVAFSKPVTLNGGLTLVDGMGAEVLASIALDTDGSTATITPASDLATNSSFELRAAATVSDRWSPPQRLARPFASTFKTGAAVPSSAISSFNPTMGPVGAAVTISGSGFGTRRGGSIVTIDGVPVNPSDYLDWSDTSVTIRIPRGAGNGAAGAGAEVLVFLEDGTKALAKDAFVVTCSALSGDDFTRATLDTELWNTSNPAFGTLSTGSAGLTAQNNGRPSTRLGASESGVTSRCALIGDFDVSVTASAFQGFSQPSSSLNPPTNLTATLTVGSTSGFSFSVGRVTGSSCLGAATDDVLAQTERGCTDATAAGLTSFPSSVGLRISRTGQTMTGWLKTGVRFVKVFERKNTDPLVPLAVALSVGTGDNTAPAHTAVFSGYSTVTPDCTGACADANACATAQDCTSKVCAGGQCAAAVCTDGVKNGAETDKDCGGTCPACKDGLGCAVAADCASGVCTAGKCVSPGCADGVKNGLETDVDCGGSCGPCKDGAGCATALDCASGVCSASKICSAPSCTDGLKNGTETDADCGGSCSPCGAGKVCAANTDCSTGLCASNRCASAGCSDGNKNGSETDVDCGGSCAPCSSGRDCLGGSDCASGVCTSGKCAAPTCTDGARNGSETDIDCGGSCGVCGDGRQCAAGADCASGVCSAGRCAAASCADKVKNGAESDVDCGGACAHCASGRACKAGADCLSGICSSGVCAAPLCADAVKNGNETDVDCGGSCPSACAGGLGCNAGTDCVSGVCASNVCASANCNDQVRNGVETDVDCGGSCGPCRDGRLCQVGADCASGVCAGGRCAAATCTDKVRNGNETDVDCGGVCGQCGVGRACAGASDCASGICSSGQCVAPTCSDNIKNGVETDVDCGGTCGACTAGRGCVGPTDCTTGVCSSGKCALPSCSDTVKNGNETDVDCGGTCSTTCAVGRTCAVGADCATGICTSGKCANPSCGDGLRNGSETDVDCGGSCGPCANNSTCSMAADCLSAVCSNGRCAAPTCADTVANGTETDVDCGGGTCAACGSTKLCAVGTDCASGVCQNGRCSAATCTDGVKNGSETDVDCGGACGKCSDGLGCGAAADCTSGVCVAKVCQAPLCNDGVKNGSETAIDCGGGTCSGCALGAACNVGADCASKYCNNFQCATPPGPALTSITPNAAGANAIVTLTGSNFLAGATVTFIASGTSYPAPWALVDSATSMRAAVPSALPVGAVADVKVTNTDGKSSTLTAAFTMQSTPTVTISVPTTVNASDTSLDGKNVVVTSTLTISGHHDLASLTVNAGGIVTHPKRDAGGIDLTIGGALAVNSGGAMDVTGLGYRGGLADGNTSTFGETWSASGATTVGGSSGLSGGGFGGQGGQRAGGTVNATYGTFSFPNELGSGGAGQTSYVGGNGGGLIRITAASISVIGRVNADGGNASNAGGGSGGSVRLMATNGAFSGTGTITAKGGAAVYGSGGGGRIAITGFTGSTYTGTIFASSPSASPTGSPGTVFLKAASQTSGDLILDNNGAASAPVVLPGSAWDTVTLRGSTVVGINSTVAVSTFNIASGAQVTLAAGASLSPTTFTMSGGGAVLTNNGTLNLPYFAATSVFGTSSVYNEGVLVLGSDYLELGGSVTLYEDGDLHGKGRAADTVGSAAILSGGVLTHTAHKVQGLSLSVVGLLDVKSGGVVEGNGLGYRGGLNDGSGTAIGETYGASGSPTTVNGSTGVSGGSYGGFGGLRAGGTVAALYGVETNPGEPGGGGAGNTATYPGGNGGGVLRLSVGSLNVSGRISADGQGVSYSGGGAGGAVKITVNGGAVSGAGSITARGGSSVYGSGGGGRVALIGFGSNGFTGTLLASPGSGAPTGSPGTVFLKSASETSGEIVYDSANVAGQAVVLAKSGMAWDSFTVRGGALVSLNSSASVGTLGLASGGQLTVGTGASLSPTTFTAGGTNTSLVNDGTVTLPFLNSTNVLSGASLVNHGTMILTNDTVELGGGVTLVEDGDLHGASRAADTVGSVTILSGGVLTHTAQKAKGLSLTSVGLFDVKAGGAVDVSGLGYRGGLNDGNPTSIGETFSAGGAGTTSGGSTGVSGGSYGGLGGVRAGGTVNALYGDQTAPNELGSGGAGNTATYPGGDGGGLAVLNVGALNVAGRITCDGQAVSYSGGGSGGGIRIAIAGGNLTGAGSITARGGSSVYGSGGGGRIAITGFASNAFTGTLTAASSGGSPTGGPGTVFLKGQGQSNGDLIVDGAAQNGVPVSIDKTGLTYDAIRVRNGGKLTVNVPVTAATLAFSTNADVTISAGAAINGVTSATIASSTVTNLGTLTLPNFTPVSVATNSVITNGGTLVITSDALDVGDGVDFVNDGDVHGPNRAPNTLSTITVENTGLITHSAQKTKGLVLNAVNLFDVKAGGAVDVSARGYRGGYSDGNPVSIGETWSSGGAGTTTNGATGVSGGSYGGLGGLRAGGTVNPLYGSESAPAELGSGGAGNTTTYPGGNGGGYALITAGALNVNGRINSDGQAVSYSGGGSGGALQLVVNGGALSGSGTIAARGGSSVYGSGGGGRVSIVGFASNTFTGTLNAAPAGGTPVGTAGTVFLKGASQSNGELILDAGNVAGLPFVISKAGLTYDAVRVRNQGKLTVNQSLSAPVLAVTANSDFVLGTGATLSTTTFNLSGSRLTNAGTLTIPSFTFTNVAASSVLTNTGTLVVTADALDIGDSSSFVNDGDVHGPSRAANTLNTIAVESTGVITHSPQSLKGLVLNAVSTLDVKTGGAIDASARGYRGGLSNGNAVSTGETYGSAGAGTTSNGSTGVSGGSYGGLGGLRSGGTINPLYGSETAPAELGSGGAGNTASYPGGDGGGLVVLSAGSVNVSGRINSDGEAVSYSGGGSGGAVRITVNGGSLTGTGVIAARGGSSVYGAGGGGRVAITGFAQNTFTGTLNAAPGSGSPVGSAGTVFLKSTAQTNGELILDAANIAGVPFAISRTGLTYDVLRVRNQAKLDLNSTVGVTSLFVTANSDLDVASGVTLNTTDATISASRVTNDGSMTLALFNPTTVLGGAVFTNTGTLVVKSDVLDVGDNVDFVNDGDVHGPSRSANTLNTITVESTGLITHSGQSVKGLVLNAVGTLDVKAGGAIDTSARGYRGGLADGNPVATGETWSTGGVATTNNGSTAVSGGSYGGFGGLRAGGTVNPLYGSDTAPAELGSGGAGNTATYPGGNGGGFIALTAGTLNVAGRINSDGQAVSYSGAGSGGAVRITVNGGAFSGNGVVAARGGSSVYGGGGGGRVALTGFGQNTFSGTLSAAPGTGAPVGASGSVFLRSSSETKGELIVDGGNTSPVATVLSKSGAYDLVQLRNGARVTFAANTTTDSLSIASGSQATVNTGVTLSAATSGTISGSGTVLTNQGTLNLPSFNPTTVSAGAKVVNQGTLVLASDVLDVGSSVTFVSAGDVHGPSRAKNTVGSLIVESTGVITGLAQDAAGVSLTSVGALDIRAGGTIDVSGLGYRGGYSNGNTSQFGEIWSSSGPTTLGGATGLSGGGYGGAGGVRAGGTTNAAYGSEVAPAELGSGGAGNTTATPGGDGGGLVTLTGASLTLNGALLADGEAGGSAGGGSGGGVKIVLTGGSFSGAGGLYARGGSSTYGGGGGGRISVTGFASNGFTGTVSAAPGTGSNVGAPGTVFLMSTTQTNGELILDAGGIANSTDLQLGSSGLAYDLLRVRGAAKVALKPGLSIGQLFVSGGANVDVGLTVNLNLSAWSVSGAGTTLLNRGTMAVPYFHATSVFSGAQVTNAGSMTLASDYLEIANTVTLIKDGEIHGANRATDTVGSAAILSGGVVTHTQGQVNGLTMSVAGLLDVKSGGAINVNGKGFRGGYSNGNTSGTGETYGTNGNATTTGGSTGKSGGSYGGLGGTNTGTPAATYGTNTAPAELGSGGGSPGSGTPGGDGGGLVRLNVGSLTLNGAINANGTGTTTAGAGSGGGVQINIATGGTMSGTGQLTATGGAGGTTTSGGGGGGRIALLGGTKSGYTGTPSVAGGVGSTAGAVGTLVNQ